jgi:hypothetical protein
MELTTIAELVADTILADKPYDADGRVIEQIQAEDKTVVIRSHRNRTTVRD